MSTLSLLGIGDILVDRSNPEEVFAEIRPLFGQADLSIGNFEGVLTDQYQAIPGSAQATVVPARNVEALRGFTILSLANNHAMDAGYGGLQDTISTLSSHGIRVVGAGASLSEAMAPVIVERQGLQIGIVAATSVFKVGTEARKALPGIAPLRAHDYYGPRHPGDYGPGVPPRIVSILDEGDWERLAEVMKHVRRQVDILIVSIHWGDYSRPWVLTEHELSCARKFISAGADIIFGHHHHFMRGTEFIGGKPVFYGLGHLSFDHPRFIAELCAKGVEIEGMSEHERRARYGEFGIYPRQESPNFPFHPLARKTGIAIVEVNKAGIIRSGIIPCFIDKGEITRPIRRNSSEWSSAVTFLKECMEKGGVATRVIDQGWVYHSYDIIEIVPDIAF